MKRTILLRGPRSEAAAIQAVMSAAREKKLHSVRIEEHDPKRTLAMNDRMWAICRQVAHLTGHTAEEIKKAACAELLGQDIYSVAGLSWTEPKGTSKLGKKAFSIFVDQLESWAVDTFQIEL